MIEGSKMNLGGQDYTVPPLNFRQLKQFGKEIKAVRNLGTSSDPMAELVTLVPVIAAAFKRNYPDLTEDQVMDLLDLGNYRAVFEAVLGVTPELRKLLDERLAAIRVGETKPLPQKVQ